MATIRKLKNKRFLAEVRKYGQQKSKTFDAKIQAMTWAVETEQSLDPQGLVKGKTLGDLFARYRDEISPSKKSYRSEYNRLNKLSRDTLAQMLLADIRQQHFDEWITQALKSLKSALKTLFLEIVVLVSRRSPLF